MTLVSVVIPNYNGAATLGETLESVRAQTHAELEILVVDDGSTDGSVTLAERHAAEDARIRLIRQANAGVAAARNAGWRAAKSDLIAFVDSDDLWAPDKIARQLARILADDAPGLVYSGNARIDADSNEIERLPCADHEGSVLERLIVFNFIGNGSAVLVRRWVLEKTDGFESALYRARAQGCEDLLFYCRAAEHCRFGAVPDHLVGYRILPDNMSSDSRRMLKSWLMVVEEIGGRHLDLIPQLELGFRLFAIWTTRRSLFERKPAMLARILAFLLPRRPVLAARIILLELPRALFGGLRERRRRRRRAIAFATAMPHKRPAFLKGADA